jgi:N-acetylgalactosamine kinase
MQHAFPSRQFPGLRLTLNGNITQGGGQSSSSALAVTTALALAQFEGLEIDRRLLAERCGEGEWYVGTRGGSGDHAAILLGHRDGLVHLCFRAPVGIRDVRYSGFPEGYQLLVANSQTRSEKSAEERLMFNRGVFAYRFAFLALRAAMRDLGIADDVIAGTESLGDLNIGRVELGTLYQLLMRLPETVSCRALAERFPQTFPAAARGCFGTEDLAQLPNEIPLRGAAVYGLGRVDRGKVMPTLLDQGDHAAMREFGNLMSITHDGDRLFGTDGGDYLEARRRLSDQWLGRRIEQVQRGEPQALRMESGFYGASIRELDRLVDVAQGVDGVEGAGLMGAGGGGYVLVLARRGTLPALQERLEREYYGPLNKQPDIEAWQPSAAAGRVL